MSAALRVRAATPADLPTVFAVRHEVFVVEQAVPVELERDEDDDTAVHAVAEQDGAVVGTGRLLPDGRVGRMAVRPGNRGAGVGSALLAFLERAAGARGDTQVELHAQLHARAFYERAGYRAHGGVFDDAGIAHVAMTKQLARP